MAAKTTGEEMLEQVRKISEALDFLLKNGLPESLLVLWIHKKTRINQTDVKAVLDALKSVSKDFNAPVIKR